MKNLIIDEYLLKNDEQKRFVAAGMPNQSMQLLSMELQAKLENTFCSRTVPTAHHLSMAQPLNVKIL